MARRGLTREGGAISRTLEELIDANEPGWPVAQEWAKNATNPVELLSADRARGEETLPALQVTSRSPMGAISLACGGILVDRGWLRILGSGHERITGDLASCAPRAPRRASGPAARCR